MSYRYEKNGNDTDLVFEGWAKGIGRSPVSGIGNMQAVNISTENDEVMCSYARTQQGQINSSATGTFSFLDASHLQEDFAVALNKGVWITVSASSHTGELPNGTYYILPTVGNGIVLSASYNGSAISGYTAGITASFTLVRNLSKPIASATEPYMNNAGQQHRYYILDDQGLVWVYDSATIDPTILNYSWFLPDTTLLTSATGITILNGWLLVFYGTTIGCKPTVWLGPTTPGYVSLSRGRMSSTNMHFAYYGHQGRAYFTDGVFIGSIFPISSLLTGIPNIQSYASYTASTTTGTISQLISGSLPLSYDATNTVVRVPAVFFAPGGGTIPSALTAGTLYFIQYNPSTGNFQVFDGYTVTAATVVDGGSGYLVGDTITIAGGGYTTPTLLTVATVGSGGSVATVTVTTGGSYNIQPTLPALQESTSGSGIDATFDLTFDTPAAKNLATGASGTQYFNTFYPTSSVAAGKGSDTYVFTPQALNLPYFETGTSIAEAGNTLIIGGHSNTLYPWNQVDPTPGDIIPLPENHTSFLLTVNNMVYAFAGHKGNIYVTNGSAASLALSVPDYCAGIAGTKSSYIEPYFDWGGAGFLRGRVYFSIQDQTSAKTGNCGGIWSFVPTQNFFYGQDTGLALRMENKSSYGTFNGASSVILVSQDQQVKGPQYWSGWYSSISGATYGIDFSSTTPSTSAVIETDLAPTGTLLNKMTFKQVEYKLSTPLASGETVSIKYRLNATDAFTTIASSPITEGLTELSGYYTVNFQKGQWLQLQITLQPLTSINSSFVRLVEVRVR